MKSHSNIFVEAQSHGKKVYENTNPLAHTQMIWDYIEPVIVLSLHFEGKIFMLAQSLLIIDDLCYVQYFL